MADGVLARSIGKASASSRSSAFASRRLAERFEFLKVPPLLETKSSSSGDFKQKLSGFIQTGDPEYISGMVLLKIDKAITNWVERIELKYGRRDSGVIEGNALKKLKEVYHLFANMVTANNVHIEPIGLSWSKNPLADAVEEELLNSTCLISRSDVFKPFEEIRKVSEDDIEFAINRAVEKAKKDGSCSDSFERELRESIPELSTAATVMNRRALAVMYVSAIAPEVVKEFEINGGFFGGRILLSNWSEEPSWEQKYTPWHEAIHLHKRKGRLESESPLAYAMNYLPLLFEKNPRALEKARSARDFRPEDLLVGDLDPGAREAGLALAVRVMNFCNKMAEELQKSSGIPPASFTKHNTDAFLIYFIQRYLAHLAFGEEPDVVEKTIFVYAKSFSSLLAEKKSIAMKVAESTPWMGEVIVGLETLYGLSTTQSFEQIQKNLKPGGGIHINMSANAA
ncbi:MAG: hypothetical protein V1909_02495 [Candidatus Micrarchaeota archaeon]